MNSMVLRWVAPAAFLAIMFGGIGLAQIGGQWITSGRQQVTAGQRLTPDDLRGWMTLQASADGLGMPVADLIGLIDPPDTVVLTGSTAFKDLEDLVPGFELTAFREVVRAHLTNQLPPATTPADSPTPTGPAPVRTTAAPRPVPTPTPAASATHTPAPGSTGAPSGITGSMTLRQVAQANGLDPAALVRQAGLPADVALDTPLRDLRDSLPGFEIQSVRDAVAALK